MCVPTIRQGPGFILFINNRIPVNPVCSPSRSGVGQGGVRTSPVREMDRTGFIDIRGFNKTKISIKQVFQKQGTQGIIPISYFPKDDTEISTETGVYQSRLYHHHNNSTEGQKTYPDSPYMRD
jgi:hypothetical protein